MSGDRQLVREAVAQYFGGSLVTADAGICFQGGPLNAAHLGTAFPYKVKNGAPDSYYTHGMAAGAGWGAVLTVRLGPVRVDRQAMGGPVSGWRARHYTTICDFEFISEEPHLETVEAGLDDLVDAFLDLIYADRTLGTTDAALYAPQGGRLIMQAGEAHPFIDVGELEITEVTDRGRATGGIRVTFESLTMVEA